MEAVRGTQLLLVALFLVIIALLVGLGYPAIANEYVSGKIALKIAAARDIALVIDTIYASPNDMIIYYDVDLSDFVVKIENKIVKVQSYDRDPTAAQYGFVPINDDPGVPTPITINNPKKIKFQKSGGDLTVTKV